VKKERLREPVDWVLSFTMEDGREFITDKCLLIDQKYVQLTDLPEDGNRRQYKRMRTLMAREVVKRFKFSEMVVMESGHYAGPCHLFLNRKYIDFLLQRIPEGFLGFGMTGAWNDLVMLYREDECIGGVMPYMEEPKFDEALIAQAEAGDAYAQLHMGRFYLFGEEVPMDFKKAKGWLLKALSNGQGRAGLLLGLSYFSGADGVKVDWEKSLEFFDRAIELGCNDALEYRNRAMKLSEGSLAEHIREGSRREEEGLDT